MVCCMCEHMRITLFDILAITALATHGHTNQQRVFGRQIALVGSERSSENLRAAAMILYGSMDLITSDESNRDVAP